MSLFEGYERRIDQINEVCKQYGLASIEDAKKAQLDPHGRPTRLKLHNVNVPVAMETLIFKCLAYRQEDRYPSMSLVMRDLETMV